MIQAKAYSSWQYFMSTVRASFIGGANREHRQKPIYVATNISGYRQRCHWQIVNSKYHSIVGTYISKILIYLEDEPHRLRNHQSINQSISVKKSFI